MIIIMCAGEGKRWGNYLGIPKQFIEINGETLIGRTTRLLKERGKDYYITGDDRFKKYGKVIPQSYNDAEIDRFERVDVPIIYLYGDVYYTEEALDKILNTEPKDILFFGNENEIYAVRVNDLNLFYKHKDRVKRRFLTGEITRCLGWEIYKSLHDIPFQDHRIEGRFILINDLTDDIDYKEDYENFVKERTNEI